MFKELVLSDTSKGLVHVFFAQRATSKVLEVIMYYLWPFAYFSNLGFIDLRDPCLDANDLVFIFVVNVIFWFDHANFTWIGQQILVKILVYTMLIDNKVVDNLTHSLNYVNKIFVCADILFCSLSASVWILS